MSETYRDDDELSDVRVGLAAGPVVVREADLFGPVVNRASRIVNIAFPGTVVCSAELPDALADDPAFVWKPIGQRNLKDIGKVPLFVLRREAEPERRGHARAHHGAPDGITVHVRGQYPSCGLCAIACPPHLQRHLAEEQAAGLRHRVALWRVLDAGAVPRTTAAAAPGGQSGSQRAPRSPVQRAGGSPGGDSQARTARHVERPGRAKSA